MHRENANRIAPLDTGNLRRDTTITGNGNNIKVVWNVPYAGKVYEKNLKNPSTTRWAEKDLKTNSKKYIEVVSSVIQ